MAVSGSSTTPKVEFYSDIDRWWKDPNLYVVGRWSNHKSLTGDASGGIAQIQLQVLPDEPVLPWLPKLFCWWSIEQFSYYDNTGATSVIQINLSDEFDDSFSYRESSNTVEGLNAIYNYNPREIIYRCSYAEPVSKGTFGVSVENNVDTKTYRLDAGGLLLKTKEQLIGEDLWNWQRKKADETKWFRGAVD